MIIDGGKGEVNLGFSTGEFMGSEVECEGGGGGGGGNINLMEEGGKGELVMDNPYYLDKFTLFETPSNYYMIGRDEKRLRWRVLKIGRLESSELIIYEDPTIYSYPQCKSLLQDINEVNKMTGGHKFVTDCYGIVGFIRFLGPCYLLLITERREIGRISGHIIYGISEYKMIPVPYSTVWSCMDNSEREKRYKKLLWLVDIRKDFFFSYSYPIMHSLQKNLGQPNAGHSSDGTMFVWNEFLTHQIRNHLKSTLWTVALVHGFFKQVELSTGGRKFLLTLIARRSSQFAGTRYNKRGVNKEGQAANDVEIEQIVSGEGQDDDRTNITSVVQNRGSIPVRWSQNPSLLVIRPEILLSRNDNNYEATQLYFLKLRQRYGDPIILLNLIKACEKKRREAFLHDEFHKAVNCINLHLEKEYHLQLLNLDLDAAFRKKGADVLTELKYLAARAMRQTGLFSCQISQPINFHASYDLSYRAISNLAHSEDSDRNYFSYFATAQKGIFRTNCLDSLDRSNFGQFAFSLVALGHQLDAIKLIRTPDQDLDDKLVYSLMCLYEALGDAIAEQYGGSAAHSKIFSKIKGQCKAATIIQELVKSLQRHINNSFLDFDKQQAIDLFLGQVQPDCDLSSTPKNLSQVNNIQRPRRVYLKRMSRSTLKRSQSDSDILYEGSALGGELSSSDSDFSELRCSYVSSGRLLTDYEKYWYGGMYKDKDTDEVASLDFTGTSGEDESEEGWAIVNYPANSPSG